MVLNKKTFYFIDSDLEIIQSYTHDQLFDMSTRLSHVIPLTQKPVLLLFENVLDFIISFLACRKAGVVSVPLFFPKNKRHFQKLAPIIEDSQCEIVICEEKHKSRIEKGLNDINHNLRILSIDDLKQLNSTLNNKDPQDLIFIQYTSGSTSNPKGVEITQENLVTNHEMIRQVFDCDESSIILSWLPFYHDMGLIGSILHALYVGATCVLMSPITVIQSPLKWLFAISKFNVTHSGGPNFIYDQCNNQTENITLPSLNLHSWKVAYNGSEVIKRATIEKFITNTKHFGFKKEAYYTCYGLAEATLLVSGGCYTQSLHESVSSGLVNKDIEVKFFDAATKQINDSRGEIIISGKSVTRGYYNRPEVNENELFITYHSKTFLRTGDVGYLEDNRLFITGRHKEMLIFNGKNYYPYDIENSLSAEIDELEVNGVILSSVEELSLQKPIVFAEIKKQCIDLSKFSEITKKIDQMIVELLGVEPHDVLLFTPRKLSRTSSGKLQRIKTRIDYLNGNEDFLYSKKRSLKNEIIVDPLIDKICNNKNIELIKQYLLNVLGSKLKIIVDDTDLHKNFYDLGIDSLMSVDIVNTINTDLDLNIDVIKLMNIKTIQEMVDYMENLLWVRNSENKGEEIII